MLCLTKVSNHATWAFRTYQITKEQYCYVLGGTYVPRSRLSSIYNQKTQEEKFFFVGNEVDFKDFQNVIKYLND